MFRVTIEEVDDGAPPDESGKLRYQQVVDVLDMRAVMSAVNQRPRKPRERKTKETT